MKKSVSLVVSGLLLLCLNMSRGVPAWGQDDQRALKLFDDLQRTIISVSDAIKPSVVHIEVVKKTGQIKYKSLASGLIVDKEGFILTNEHVVDDAQSVIVTLPSKIEYPAEIIGTDKQTDPWPSWGIRTRFRWGNGSSPWATLTVSIAPSPSASSAARAGCFPTSPSKPS
jgi:hypothetical protein